MTEQNKRPRLADILVGDTRTALARVWEETAVAPGFEVLPKGRYLLEAVAGNLESNRNNTPAYCIRFRVIASQTPWHGRILFHRFYLTTAALAMSKRDLATLGITALEQLEQTLPQGLRIEADVIVRTLDDGREVNELRNLKAAPPAAPDPFAPLSTETGKEPPEPVGQPALTEVPAQPKRTRASKRSRKGKPLEERSTAEHDGGNKP